MAKKLWGHFSSTPSHFVDENGEILDSSQIHSDLRDIMSEMTVVMESLIRRDFPGILASENRDSFKGFKIAAGRKYGWDKCFNGSSQRQKCDISNMVNLALCSILPALLQQANIVDLIKKGKTDAEIKSEYGFYVSDTQLKHMRRRRSARLPKPPQKMVLSACDNRRFVSKQTDDAYTISLPFWRGKTVVAVFTIPPYLRGKDMKISRPEIRFTEKKVIWDFSWCEDNVAPAQGARGVLGVDAGKVKPACITLHERDYYSGEIPLPKYIQRCDERVKDLQKRRVETLNAQADNPHKRARQKLYAKRLKSAISIKKKERARLIAQWIVDTASANNMAVSVEQLRWAQGGLWERALLREEIVWRAERAGVLVVEVSARQTSQTCCMCGGNVKHNTRSRTMRCVDCDFTEDRDVNASHNIAKRGQKHRRVNVPPLIMLKAKNFLRAKKSAPSSGVLRFQRGESSALIYDTFMVGNDPTSLKNTKNYHTAHLQ